MQAPHLILSLVTTFIMSVVYAAQPVVCSQEFALCTSAPCVPDPRSKEYAICSCVVEKGESVGYKSCKDRMPKQWRAQTRQIVSTFSFQQFSTKKSMSCPKGMPWTNCVDAPCTINPMEPDKAICSCKIIDNQPFFTFGGNCDTKTCANGFWSGATKSSDSVIRNTLLEKLNQVNNPPQETVCRGTDINVDK
jgi:hypothetical protein